MKVAVWDTWVKRDDGRMMNFDIVVPVEMRDEMAIYAFGNEYLVKKGILYKELTSTECQYCHAQWAAPHWEEAILQKGYYICELSNCD